MVEMDKAIRAFYADADELFLTEVVQGEAALRFLDEVLREAVRC